MSQTQVSMIGLGKLGLPVAESMAKKHKVIGYDINKDIQSTAVQIKDSIPQSIKDSKIIFIAVPTPHDTSYGGETPSSNLPVRDFDYSALINVLKELKSCVDDNQLIVNISTVLPGTLRSIIKNLGLEKQFIYNPYLIAMGTVAQDFLDPDLLMIGNDNGTEDDNVKNLIDFYSTIVKIEKHTSRPYIMIGTYEDAECTKIFHNTYISAKIGIANMIQDVTHRLGNSDPDKISMALQHADRVIGKRYMQPGMGDGGPCHPRDNIALSWLANKLSLSYDLFKSIMHAREQQTLNIAEMVSQVGLPVCILGKSFKPETELTDGSTSLLLGHYLQYLGYDVCYEEPRDLRRYCFVLCHDKDYSNYDFNNDSVVIDVYRKFKTDRQDLQVLYYGKKYATETILTDNVVLQK